MLNIYSIKIPKVEADDIIAYIAKRASKANKKVTIVSSDKDFFQLIDNNIEVYAPVKKKTFTYENVVEDIGVLPQNYNIVKALLGDNSDNLVGVKGLGIKTILSEWKSLKYDPLFDINDIYNVAEEKLEEKKIFPKIIMNWDKVLTNFKLMDLHNTQLDEKEIQFVEEVLKHPVPNLQTGAFLHMLDQDKIEGITKNTEAWLENYRALTTVQ